MSNPQNVRAGLPELPQRMRKLPVDERGYPVPYFTAWVDGKPEFRAADAAKLQGCVRFSLCWVCGDPLGRLRTFVIGPMCAINRNTAEPPSHVDCARFSATACPVLTHPQADCNRGDKLEGSRAPAGFGLKGNPGVTCLWTTDSYKVLRESNGVLFRLGDPHAVEWYTEGRQATRAEVLASLDRRLPLLRPIAEQDGPAAIAELDRRYDHFLANLAPAS